MDAFAALKPGVGTLTEALEQALSDAPDIAQPVQALLIEARAALLAVAEGAAAIRLSTDHLSADARTLMGEVLGEGEVKALIKRPDGGEDRVLESVMPGLWRVLVAGDEFIEVADVPQILRDITTAQPLGLEIPDPLPEGAMNVASVLLELDNACRAFEVDGSEREVNLTLLPMTPVDMEVLDRAIGVGPIAIVSLGYGNCRIDACARRHLWTVRYYNTEDKQILNAVQAGDVPVAARATSEDMRDSAERLGEMTTSLFQ
jgi:hydrogenase-1 operon protein HyaF